MYNISGDGSWKRTVIRKDDEIIGYTKCEIFVDIDRSTAIVDGVEGSLDFITLFGYHRFIGAGAFENTAFYNEDHRFRGLQNAHIIIEKGKPTMVKADFVWLPNLAEWE